ncbi:MAG: hypothetical protein K2K56_05550 [Lachnospiraceae bacterium]|nr:hypothetical protein [Lachnospiraceae bacterium]MDE6625814.1 hypothetical protein [Lachnospiraceae bacterium]
MALSGRRKDRANGSGKAVFSIYLLLRLSVFGVLIAQFLNRNYENVFLCILTLILFIVPAFVERKLRIRIPDLMETIILLFIYAAEIMGEIHSMYIRIPVWDTILHTLNGFLMAAIGFSLVDLLNRNDKFSFKLSPLYLAIVAFCFSMTIGVFWEFFEFSMDYCFKMDMQKDTVLTAISSVTLDPEGLNNPVVLQHIDTVMVNGEMLPVDGYLDIGLYDTMEDLFVNFVGAVVFSVIGFFYVKNKGRGKKGKLVEKFIPEIY